MTNCRIFYFGTILEIEVCDWSLIVDHISINHITIKENEF